MKNRTAILQPDEIATRITRMAYQICEDASTEESHIVLVGIAGNGNKMVAGLKSVLDRIHPGRIDYGEVVIDKEDPTSKALEYKGITHQMMEDSRVVVVDDVINSGRTMMHVLADAIGQKPRALKTAVLVNRTHRRFPVHANYVGLSISSTLKDRVEVEWGDSNNPVAYLT